MGEVGDNCVLLTTVQVSAIDVLYQELFLTGDLHTEEDKQALTERQLVVDFLLNFYDKSDKRSKVEEVKTEEARDGHVSKELPQVENAPPSPVKTRGTKKTRAISKSKPKKRKTDESSRPSRKLSKLTRKKPVKKVPKPHSEESQGGISPVEQGSGEDFDEDLENGELDEVSEVTDQEQQSTQDSVNEADICDSRDKSELQPNAKVKNELDSDNEGNDGSLAGDSDVTISNYDHDTFLDELSPAENTEKSTFLEDELSVTENGQKSGTEESDGYDCGKKKSWQKKLMKKKIKNLTKKGKNSAKKFTKVTKQKSDASADQNEVIEEDDEFKYRKIEEPTSDLTTHQIFFRVAGKKPKLLMCRVCGRQFTKKDHMIHHARSHTGERPYKCGVCNKAYNRRSHLTRHAVVHMDVVVDRPPRKKNFKCDQCSAAYDCRYKLTEHRALHTGEKPNKCSKCDFRTRCRENLRRHMGAMHGTGPRLLHSCPQCSKVYTSRASMKDHLKRCHEDISPVVCEVCGKHFKTLQGLKEHYICHDDKIFKCQYCKFKTNRPKYFRLHESNHVTKICQCEICGKGLSSLGALKNHLQSVHGPKIDTPKVYSCRFCGATYDNKQSMNSHMRKHKNKMDDTNKDSDESSPTKIKVKKKNRQISQTAENTKDSSQEIMLGNSESQLNMPLKSQGTIPINSQGIIPVESLGTMPLDSQGTMPTDSQGTIPDLQGMEPTRTNLHNHQNNAELSQNNLPVLTTVGRMDTNLMRHAHIKLPLENTETNLLQRPFAIETGAGHSLMPLPLNLGRPNHELEDIISRSRNLEQCQQIPLDGASVPRTVHYDRNVFGSVHEPLHSINASTQDLIKYGYHSLNMAPQDYVKYS